MSVEVNAVVALIAGILLVASTVSAAVAVSRTALSKSTIETLETNNKALTERVDILEAEGERLKGEKAEQAQRLVALVTENETLRSIASGTAAIVALRTELKNDYHDILAALQAIPTAVLASHGEVLEVVRDHCEHGGHSR